MVEKDYTCIVAGTSIDTGSWIWHVGTTLQMCKQKNEHSFHCEANCGGSGGVREVAGVQKYFSFWSTMLIT
jgi:hypothetical protein